MHYPVESKALKNITDIVLVTYTFWKNCSNVKHLHQPTENIANNIFCIKKLIIVPKIYFLKNCLKEIRVIYATSRSSLRMCSIKKLFLKIRVRAVENENSIATGGPIIVGSEGRFFDIEKRRLLENAFLSLWFVPIHQCKYGSY